MIQYCILGTDPVLETQWCVQFEYIQFKKSIKSVNSDVICRGQNLTCTLYLALLVTGIAVMSSVAVIESEVDFISRYFMILSAYAVQSQWLQGLRSIFSCLNMGIVALNPT